MGELGFICVGMKERAGGRRWGQYGHSHKKLDRVRGPLKSRGLSQMIIKIGSISNYAL